MQQLLRSGQPPGLDIATVAVAGGDPPSAFVARRLLQRPGLTPLDVASGPTAAFTAQESIPVAQESILVAQESLLVPQESILVAQESILVAQESILVAQESILVAQDSILVPQNT